MRVQVGEQNRDQAIKLVEYQLQHRQFCVEQLAHIKLVDDIPQDSKTNGLVVEEQIQESGDKVHSLTVVQLRVNHSVRGQNSS